MTDLSLAADAVLDTYMLHCGWLDGPLDRDYRCVAAVLKALADQVVPHQSEPPCGEDEPWPPSYQLMIDARWEQRQQNRFEILAIADELEKGDG